VNPASTAANEAGSKPGTARALWRSGDLIGMTPSPLDRPPLIAVVVAHRAQPVTGIDQSDYSYTDM
jgi:hypothetical protein